MSKKFFYQVQVLVTDGAIQAPKMEGVIATGAAEACAKVTDKYPTGEIVIVQKTGEVTCE